jgi:hypothetical protein
MQVSRCSRFVPKWLLVFAAILIVVGNIVGYICEFSGEAHGATLAPEHQSDQSGEPHHHGAAHLTTCENDVVSTNSAHPVALDAATFTPRLEGFVEPLDVGAVVVGRLPVPLGGPPLFILHAALLI